MTGARSNHRGEAAENASNVARLPTAAPRKIDNFRYAAQREAVRAMRKTKPWPMRGLTPLERKRAEDQAQFNQMHRTPELAALLILLTAFPEDRLSALDAAADLMTTRLAGDETAAAGVFLVKHAIQIRKDCATVAKTEGC